MTAAQLEAYKEAKTKPVLFDLGKIVATPDAVDEVERADGLPFFVAHVGYTQRHKTGDWGEVPPEDARENSLSVKNGFRILSAYTLSTGVKIWLITEHDRSLTTFLLPSEY